MWYKDQNRGSVTMMAESKNLKKWITHDQPAIGGNAHEGPKVFRFGNYYWMITDEWQGLRVYRSTDLNTWPEIKLIYSTSHTRDVNHIPKPEMMNQATYRINTGEVVFK